SKKFQEIFRAEKQVEKGDFNNVDPAKKDDKRIKVRVDETLLDTPPLR
ncbi:22732_t:CDS:1, partial [Rhizophagus irregularis]